MNSQFVPTSPPVATDYSQSGDTILHGRLLIAARIAWLAITALTLGLFIASIPTTFAVLHVLCTKVSCIEQLTPDYVQELQAAGFSLDFYVIYSLVLISTFTLGYVAVGVVLFWRKSDDWMALFASLSLVTFAITFSGTVEVLPPPWQLPAQFITFLGSICIVLFFYIFPNGRFAPHWVRWLTIGVIVYWGAKVFFNNAPFNPFIRFPLLNTLTFVGFVGCMVVVQIYRYVRVSTLVQRQQTKWVVFGMSLALGGYLSLALLSSFLPSLFPHGPVNDLIIGTGIYFLLLLIPLSIAFAILRSRLWEIDIIINRTLVYGALTACIVGLYVLIVGGLSIIFQTRGNFIISLIATGLVAVLFQPLRARLQHGVNRLMYGERDVPLVVLSRLGQRIEATLALDTVLPTIVETVAQALKLPYTAIALKQEDGLTTVASYGTSEAKEGFLHVPLVSQTETIGELVLAPRAPGEAFSTSDRQLLHDLAYQVSVAVHAIRLTADLQRLTVDLQNSRERIVLAREEERRRLRRDLHDDLGPTLAALALTASTVADLIPTEPTAAVSLVNELQNEIRATVGNVRRLVYELRPPTLDELGLVAAIRERAVQSSSHHKERIDAYNGLHVVVKAPETLPPLPAAVEVAAYRIVQEALTNVNRHAKAQNCLIQLSLVEASSTLQVEIIDDGVGLPAERHMGVGLLSMRERAAELGGSCTIEKMNGSGTRVCTQLPISKG